MTVHDTALAALRTDRPCPGPRTEAELAALAADLDAIRLDTMAQVGHEDARYIRRLLWAIRGMEAGGILWLLMAPWWPTFWLGGIVLGCAKILQNMAFGHNVMHGQYNWMNDPRFDSHSHEWDLVCSNQDWRLTHNYEHHTFTNVQGMDRDFGFGTMRLSGEIPWTPRFLFQVPFFVINCLVFDWGVGTYNLHLEKLLKEPETTRARIRALWPQVRAKMWRETKRDYVLWPLIAAGLAWLAGAGAWQGGTAMALGMLTANVIRSSWACVIIMCGHLTEGIYTFEAESLHHESRGRWYLRQILCSANIRGGWLMHLATGNLSHQIEHHLYPDMPAPRYARIAPRVQAVCRKHGLPYRTGSLTRQFSTFLLRLARHSVPGGEQTLGSLRRQS